MHGIDLRGVLKRPVLYLACHVFLVGNESLLTQGNKDNKIGGLDSQFGREKQSRPFYVIWCDIVSDIQRGMLNSVSENEFSPSAKQCGESPDHLILDF